MKNSELFQLVFQCLTKDEKSGFNLDFKDKIISNEDNLLRFIHLSSNHLVLPAIYNQFLEWGYSDYLPPDLAEHLNDIFQFNRKRNEEIIQQIDEINFHLNNAGIEPVYMKGTANLLDGLYNEIGERMIGDIDFLVRDKDFLPTVEIVSKLGYKTDIEIYDDIETLKDYPRLFRSDVPADIEIHRLPVIPEYSKWFTPEIIFKEKRQIQDKINCFVPTDEHKLIQNFIHSQLSNKGHKLRLVSLRDLFDCHLLLKRVNKNEVLTTIKEREKAEIYFDFTQSLLNNRLVVSDLDKKSKSFITNHNWYYNHPKTHYFYIKFFKTKDLLSSRFFKAFVDKSTFKNLVVRLSKPEWWKKRLFKGLKDYFS